MFKPNTTLEKLDVKGKVVVVRTNYDLPDISLAEFSQKIKSSIKTIKHLSDNNAKVVILSHMGNPNGKYVDELSLMPIRFELGRFLNKPIKFVGIAQCTNSIKYMNPGEILLIENTKFEFGEISKELKEKKAFVKNIADQINVYVNEAFGVEESLSTMTTLSSYAKEKTFGFNYIDELESIKKYNFKKFKKTTLIYGGIVNEKKLKILPKAVKSFKNVIVGGDVSLILNKLTQDFDSKELLKSLSKTKNLHVPTSYSTGEAELKLNEIKTTENLKDISKTDIENFLKIISESDFILWIGSLSIKDSIYSAEKFGEFINLNTSKECIKIISGDNLSKELSDANIILKRFNHVSIDGVEYLSNLV